MKVDEMGDNVSLEIYCWKWLGKAFLCAVKEWSDSLELDKLLAKINVLELSGS